MKNQQLTSAIILLMAALSGMFLNISIVQTAADTPTPRFSVLAQELIDAYPRRKDLPDPSRPETMSAGYYGSIAPLAKEHLADKYRHAWEELLLVSVDPAQPRFPSQFHTHIIRALHHYANPESIPVLGKAFNLTLKGDVFSTYTARRQKEILSLLRSIVNKESLEVIFESLDKLDQAYGDKALPSHITGRNAIREEVFIYMMQPYNPGKSKRQQRGINRADRWQKLISGYKPPGKVSLNNEAFLDRVRSFKRKASE